MSYLNITLKYTFSSEFGQMNGYRYAREVDIDIMKSVGSGTPNEKIGFAKLIILFLDQAENDGFDLDEIFDSYEYSYRHGQNFYDYDEHNFNSLIYDHYKHMLVPGNVCILERMEILPAFRGLKIGQKVIKDITFHFSSTVSLFVLQAYPLQFEISNDSKSEWDIMMKLEDFEKDKIMALKKLNTYYEKCGFEKVKGIDELLFYNPEIINKKMSAINLEELVKK